MEDFKILIEIQSHLNKVKEHQLKIDENNNRITFVSKQKVQREVKRDEIIDKNSSLNIKISQLEKELFSKETELEKATKNLDVVTTQNQLDALNKEITILSPQVENLQEDIFSLMEKVEKNELEVETLKGFILGVDETIKEIQAEVDQENDIEKREIAKFNDRINLLVDQLSPNIKSYYQAMIKKSQKILSFINGGSCSNCRYQIPSAIVQEIETGRSQELCGGCERILIPSFINSVN